MKEVIEVTEKNIKEVKKYLKKLSCKNKKYDITISTTLNNNEIEDLKKIVTALNIKDIEKRYSYIYDEACYYLDNEFKTKNICDFQDNKCIAVRKKTCHDSDYGCCYGINRGVCKNLENKKCKISSLSCKLFTCRYLRKKGIKYRVKDIPILDFFFNIREKYIIEYSIFKDKDEIIKELLKVRF